MELILKSGNHKTTTCMFIIVIIIIIIIIIIITIIVMYTCIIGCSNGTSLLQRRQAFWTRWQTFHAWCWYDERLTFGRLIYAFSALRVHYKRLVRYVYMYSILRLPTSQHYYIASSRIQCNSRAFALLYIVFMRKDII